MTEYERISAERTAASLKRLIEGAQRPIGFTELAENTGLSKGYVRQMIQEHPQHFNDAGWAKSTGSRKMKVYQANPLSREQINENSTQVIYHNPYNQLMQIPDFVPRQYGQVIPWSDKHNVRMSGKKISFVSGATLSWI